MTKLPAVLWSRVATRGAFHGLIRDSIWANTFVPKIYLH